MDLSAPPDVNGRLDEGQSAWLLGRLRAVSGKWTILLGHHPLQSAETWFSTRWDGEFSEAIRKSDTLAYLCGHTHAGEFRLFCGVPHVTAESTAFGVDCTADTMSFCERRGYNQYFLKDGALQIQNRVILRDRRYIHSFILSSRTA